MLIQSTPLTPSIYVPHFTSPRTRCGWIFDAEAAAICEAVGMGPEDPAADACAALVIGSCSEILKLITEHSGLSSGQICSDLGACDGVASEAGASETVGGAFETTGGGAPAAKNAPPQVYAEFLRKVPAHP